MDTSDIYRKFGQYYIADDKTFLMGIDMRFINHIASRMKNRVVLETCTGGGFSTVSLAKYAKHVFSVEIDGRRVDNAKKNAQIAGLERKITFINNDVFSKEIYKSLPEIDVAFLDPEWVRSEEDNNYHFLNSNNHPPSDILLDFIFKKTPNVTLIQPPHIDTKEFENLPPHECESLCLSGQHKLYCLYFGDQSRVIGNTEYKV